MKRCWQAPIPSGKQITCTLSCMSRAGREPGFKKQNQDNCFAFEKYVAAGQALFGAFDGHGPNGAPHYALSFDALDGGLQQACVVCMHT